MNMRKIIALLLLFPSSAFALPPDVATDAWYSSTVSAFVDEGYLAGAQSFRPNEKATRGEFVELMVNLLGGVKHADEFALWQRFDDVPSSNHYHAAFEEAGIQGWMKGAGSCYGSHPCYGNPDRPINRAEASALLMRAFGLQAASNAPSFDDNSSNEWFTEHIKGAASLCVLRGDAGAKRVRPADNMNRAEMIVMLSRALQRENFPNCSEGTTRPTLPTAPKRPNAVEQYSEKEVEAMRALHKGFNDLYPLMLKNAAQYDTATQNELFKIADSFKTKLDELGKILQISFERKLSTKEASEMNFIGGQMKALSDQFNEVKAKANQKAVSGPDSNASSLWESYKASQQYFDYIKNSVIPIVPADLSLSILNALKPYPGYQYSLGTLANKASTSRLSSTEQQQAASDMDNMLRIQKQITSLVSSYKVPSYTAPSYNTPPATETCQQMRDRLVAEAALRGGSADVVSKQLYDAGCISLSQYCDDVATNNALSGGFGSLPAECR